MTSRAKAEFIDSIAANRYYALFFLRERPVIVFKDHRFLVPVLWLAQATGVAPQPARLFRFDAHLDAAPPSSVAAGRLSGLKTFAEVFAFAENELSDKDDDWLAFAFLAGLIGHCVTVGPTEGHGPESSYAERSRVIRTLEEALDPRKGLSAAERPVPDAGNDSLDPVLLDIDCDYFSFRWRNTQNAWPAKFYDREFDKKAAVSGGSRNGFMAGLIARAPLITIAVEPDFCGGGSEARDILTQLNRRFFDQVIALDQIACLRLPEWGP